MDRTDLARLLLALLLGPAAALAAQKPAPPAEAQEEAARRQKARQEFQDWFGRWSEGILPLRSGMVPDSRSRALMEEVFSKLAGLGDLESAQLLFKAAAAPTPRSSGADLLAMEPWLVRRTAREAIAGMTGPGVASWIASLLLAEDSDQEDSPLRAALEIAALSRPPGVLERVARLAADGKPGTRIVALGVLGRLGDPGVLPALRRFLKEGRPEIRCAAIRAMADLARPFTDQTVAPQDRPGALPETAAAAMLSDLGGLLVADREWQVRAAACDALLQLRMIEAVPELIRGLKAEAARRPPDQNRRVLLAIGRGLAGLTGQELPPDQPGAWEEWWKSAGAERRVAARGDRPARGKGAAGTYVRYFNLEVESERLLFLVDASGSMNLKIALKGRYADLPAEAIKFDLVKKELSKVVLALPPSAAVNVIFFNENVRPFRPMETGSAGLMLMNTANKEALLEYLALATAGGLTNIHAALDLALGVASGAGARPKTARSRTDPLSFDTIYMLSDGAPTTGAVIDTGRILELVDQANAVKKVVIHTITFGDVNEARFMQDLARRNGGEHVHVE